MKIFALSDTHTLHEAWNKRFKLPKADTFIYAGDMASSGNPYEIQFFLDWFGKLDYKNKIIIAGNHDKGFDNQDRFFVLDMVPEGVHYLENSEVIIDGIKFWGSPITPRFFNWAFMRERGTEIKNVWDGIPEDTNVLITHGPPFGILDYTLHEHINAGCKDLLMAVHRVKPAYMIFGHIHEAYGTKIINDTTFMNVSALNQHYQVTNPGQTFEI